MRHQPSPHYGWRELDNPGLSASWPLGAGSQWLQSMVGRCRAHGADYTGTIIRAWIQASTPLCVPWMLHYYCDYQPSQEIIALTIQSDFFKEASSPYRTGADRLPECTDTTTENSIGSRDLHV